MASTSVHLPASVVERLDRLAADRGVSRNRIILEACENLLAEPRSRWPVGFFEAGPVGPELELLRAAGREMEEAIYASRLERAVPPL